MRAVVHSPLTQLLMQERGYVVDHSTIQRWVVHYAPRIEKAFRKKETNWLALENGRDVYQN